LFTRGGLKTAIHVDDGNMSGADEKELDDAVAEILAKHPGKIIEPEYEQHPERGRIEKRDLYGATLRYSAEQGWMKISMEDAIQKIIDKHNLKGLHGAAKPAE